MHALDGREYCEATAFKDRDGITVIAPLAERIGGPGRVMFGKPEVLNPSINNITFGIATRKCLTMSSEQGKVSSQETLRAEQLPINMQDLARLHYDCYTMSITMWKDYGYEIKPWHRENGKAWMTTKEPTFTLPLDATDEQLGEAIVKAFDYIDTHFGFEKK